MVNPKGDPILFQTPKHLDLPTAPTMSRCNFALDLGKLKSPLLLLLQYVTYFDC